MIKVPSLSKKGEIMGDVYIKGSSILYARSWKNQNGDNKSVVYLVGGKDIIVNVAIEELSEILKDEKTK